MTAVEVRGEECARCRGTGKFPEFEPTDVCPACEGRGFFPPAPGAIPRRVAFAHFDGSYRDEHEAVAAVGEGANVQTSLAVDQPPGVRMHAPVLDLDVPHTYRPSDAGRARLLVEVPVEGGTHRRLLQAMVGAGLLQRPDEGPRLPTAMVLNLDVPHVYLPSSTPGHAHLLLDVLVPEPAYWLLLDVMVEAGLLERGYVEASKERGYTSIRLPWVKKAAAAALPDTALRCGEAGCGARITADDGGAWRHVDPELAAAHDALGPF